jgi:hypothetical protein
MSLITRNNYEAYMLDYVEENLSPELVAELMLFLENNSDLKEDFEGFEQFTLKPDQPIFENKEKLKKVVSVIDLTNYEDYIIAEIEKENTSKDSQLLTLFLKENPAKQKEFEVYQKTKLAAPALVFEHKSELKRKEAKVIPMYWWYSSAAAVVLVLFLLNMNWSASETKLPIADKTENTTKNIKVEKEKGLLVEENKQPEPQLADTPKIEEKTGLEFQQEVKKEEILSFPKEEEGGLVILANEPPKENIMEKDSGVIEKTSVEEVFYADDVKITYEEELEEGVETPKKKSSRVKKMFNNMLRNQSLLRRKKNQEEAIAYAVNVTSKK